MKQLTSIQGASNSVTYEGLPGVVSFVFPSDSEDTCPWFVHTGVPELEAQYWPGMGELPTIGGSPIRTKIILARGQVPEALSELAERLSSLSTLEHRPRVRHPWPALA